MGGNHIFIFISLFHKVEMKKNEDTKEIILG